MAGRSPAAPIDGASSKCIGRLEKSSCSAKLSTTITACVPNILAQQSFALASLKQVQSMHLNGCTCCIEDPGSRRKVSRAKPSTTHHQAAQHLVQAVKEATMCTSSRRTPLRFIELRTSKASSACVRMILSPWEEQDLVVCVCVCALSLGDFAKWRWSCWISFGTEDRPTCHTHPLHSTSPQLPVSPCQWQRRISALRRTLAR